MEKPRRGDAAHREQPRGDTPPAIAAVHETGKEGTLLEMAAKISAAGKKLAVITTRSTIPSCSCTGLKSGFLRGLRNTGLVELFSS